MQDGLRESLFLEIGGRIARLTKVHPRTALAKEQVQQWADERDKPDDQEPAQHPYPRMVVLQHHDRFYYVAYSRYKDDIRNNKLLKKQPRFEFIFFSFMFYIILDV